MADDKWAPEPWKVDDDKCTLAVRDANGNLLLLDIDFYPIADADQFARIVACVNACAGVPTERLLEMVSGSIETPCSGCGAVIHSGPMPLGAFRRRLKCLWCGTTTTSSDSHVR